MGCIPKKCQITFKCISILFSIVCTILAVNKLTSIESQFLDIMDAIPDPQLRIVNMNDEFQGPVQLICAPSLLNGFDTCDGIFSTYEKIDISQKYFSWLYLDLRSPITETTIDNIKSSRQALLKLIVIEMVAEILYSFWELYRTLNESKSSVAITIIKLIFFCTWKAGHMILCNLFSVSEYDRYDYLGGVFLLQYVPSYGYWCMFIMDVVFLFVIICFLYYIMNSSDPQDMDQWKDAICEYQIVACLICTFFIAMMSMYLLSGIGLYYYSWDFQNQFKKVLSGDVFQPVVKLTTEYIGQAEILRKIAIAVGFGGILDVLTKISSHWIAFGGSEHYVRQHNYSL